MDSSKSSQVFSSINNIIPFYIDVIFKDISSYDVGSLLGFYFSKILLFISFFKSSIFFVFFKS